MNYKKILVIGVCLVVVAVIAAVIYFAFAKNPSATLGGGAGTGNNDTLAVPASEALSGTPTGPMLSIGTTNGVVQVKNFYLSNPLVTDGGETVILASTTDYLITYDTESSGFWIGISAAEFNAARPGAEQALLATLEVSNADACKLDVSEGVFYSATSSLSGQSFPLSFCTSTAAGAQ